VGKHTDALKSLDEFRAPWETEGGTDAEIDKPKLRRFIFNLLTDKAKAQDARDEADEALKTAEKELETAQAEAAEANGAEAQKKIDKLQKRVDDLTVERDKLVSDKEVSELRSEALKDIDPKFHDWIQGTTQDELDASIEKFKETFGIEDGEPGDEDDPDEPTVRTTPRPILKNAADPKNGKPADQEIDWDKVADGIVGSGSPFG